MEQARIPQIRHGSQAKLQIRSRTPSDEGPKPEVLLSIRLQILHDLIYPNFLSDGSNYSIWYILGDAEFLSSTAGPTPKRLQIQILGTLTNQCTQHPGQAPSQTLLLKNPDTNLSPYIIPTSSSPLNLPSTKFISNHSPTLNLCFLPVLNQPISHFKKDIYIYICIYIHICMYI